MYGVNLNVLAERRAALHFKATRLQARAVDVVLLTLGCTTPIGLQGIVPRYCSLQEISARSAGRSGSPEGFLLTNQQRTSVKQVHQQLEMKS